MRLQLQRALVAISIAVALIAALSGSAQAQSNTPCASRYSLAWEMPLKSTDVGRPVTEVLNRSEFSTIINVRGDRNRLAIGRAPDGTVGLQMNIPKGENRSTNFFLSPLGNKGADAVCLSLRVFFENGFEWAEGGGGTKLGFGLWGGDAASQLSGGTVPSKQLGWSVRNVNNSYGFRLYSYHLNRASSYGAQGSPLAKWGTSQWGPGRWHEIQLEVVMNDPGSANGYTQIWLDGEKRQAMNNLRYRNDNVWAVRGIHFSDIWGGKTSDPRNFSPKSQKMWYADYKLYTSGKSISVQQSTPDKPKSNASAPSPNGNSPSNGNASSGSAGQFGPLAPSGSVDGRNVTLSWTPDRSADKYYVRAMTKRTKWSDRKQVYGGSVSPRTSCSSTQCSVNIGNLPRDQYEWMVRPQYGSNNAAYSALSFDVR